MAIQKKSIVGKAVPATKAIPLAKPVPADVAANRAMLSKVVSKRLSKKVSL